MSGLLESVPNLAEGRRPEVIERLVEAVGRHRGARLLDVSSDFDHDRTVLTLAGEAEPLRRALLDLYAVALDAIDLSPAGRGPGPPGVHPRLGAVDVVPFVPLGTTPMRAAVEAAEALGREVAARHGLPVFLYEEAARAPERRDLAAIRRGGFERLGEKLADPAWRPDFGPARPHPTAGATVIGARGFLIAFNAVLDSDDLEAARAIAGAVRESGGGLPAVKALGVRLASRGRVQVSMNLTDFRRTSPHAAVEAVRREAAARGVRVAACELVGLMPEGAVEAAIREALSLPGFGMADVLERRLDEADEMER